MITRFVFTGMTMRKRGSMRLTAMMLIFLLLGACNAKLDEVPDYGALPDRAIIASARNFDTRGLLWVMPASAGISFSTEIPSELASASAVTILVHGYNTPASRVASYFHGLIAYLRDDRHYGPPLVIYDWKSTARHWEEISVAEQQGYIEFLAATVGERLGGRIPGLPPGLRWESTQYSADRIQATTTGVDGLAVLIRQLSGAHPDVKIIVVAHSMGSQLVVDALRQRTDAMSAVRRVVLLAPDVDAAVFQDGTLAMLRHLDALHIFYSGQDEIVRMYSRIANFGYPRLGATGPLKVEALPSYVHVHDAGKAMGNFDVHGRYVTREGAAALRIEELLLK